MKPIYHKTWRRVWTDGEIDYVMDVLERDCDTCPLQHTCESFDECGTVTYETFLCQADRNSPWTNHTYTPDGIISRHEARLPGTILTAIIDDPLPFFVEAML